MLDGYLSVLVRVAGMIGAGVLYTLRNPPDMSQIDPIQGMSDASIILQALTSGQADDSAPDQIGYSRIKEKTFDMIGSTPLWVKRLDSQNPDYRISFDKLTRDENHLAFTHRWEWVYMEPYNIEGLSTERRYSHTELHNYIVSNRLDRAEKFLMIYDFQTGFQQHPLVKELAYLRALDGTGVSPFPLFLSPAVKYDLIGDAKGFDRFLVVEMTGINLEDFLDRRGGSIAFIDAIKMGISLLRLVERLHSTGIVHGRVSIDSVVFKQHVNVLEVDYSQDNWLLVDFEQALFYPETWKQDEFPFRGMRDDVWNVADLIGKLATGYLDGSTISPDTGHYRWADSGSWFFNSLVLENPIPKDMSVDKKKRAQSILDDFLDMIRALGLHSAPKYHQMYALLESIVSVISHDD